MSIYCIKVQAMSEKPHLDPPGFKGGIHP